MKALLCICVTFNEFRIIELSFDFDGKYIDTRCFHCSEQFLAYGYESLFKEVSEASLMIRTGLIF